jgi:hypothetical protein
MKQADSRLLAGLILFVLGAAVFAYGIITYTTERATLGGALQRVFNGSSSVEQQAIIEMSVGGVLAVIGLLLIAFRRGRSRR